MVTIGDQRKSEIPLRLSNFFQATGFFVFVVVYDMCQFSVFFVLYIH
jgi:hypothetical protein